MNNTKPHLEALEDRFLPSASDMVAFQQQVPQLQAELNAALPIIQTNLQKFLSSIEKSLTPAQQTQYAQLLAQDQWIINNFPALAQTWFNQTVIAQENYLLTINMPQSSSDNSNSGGTVYNTNWQYNPAYSSIPGNIYYVAPSSSSSSTPSSPDNSDS